MVERRMSVLGAVCAFHASHARRAHALVFAVARLSLLATVQPLGAFAATLVVPTQYATIQAAIDAAQPLDQVVVEPGTYSENLTVRSEVVVMGVETARTFLEPRASAQPTVLITLANGPR
jgi:pectin methylesterase-like acyl-CoA thioesterase